MNIFLIICLILLILVLVVMQIYLIMGHILYRMVFSKKGKLYKKISTYLSDENAQIFNKDFSKIEIVSHDNLKLRGFYKRNNSNKIVLLVHGYGGSHINMGNYAEYFDKKGYDILAIDLRAHGESEGNELSLGLEESKDLELWINKALEFNPEYKILLFGVSMGASVICLASGDNLPKNVVGVVEECGYDNADKIVKFFFSKFKIFSKGLYKIFYNYTKKSQQLDIKKIDVSSKLKLSKLNVLFIHGNHDEVVPIEMMYNLSSQLPEMRREVYISDEANHAGSYKNNKTEYERILNKFLIKCNI